MRMGAARDQRFVGRISQDIKRRSPTVSTQESGAEAADMHLDPRWLDPDGVEHIVIDYRGRDCLVRARLD